MYKVYFDNRVIAICAKNELAMSPAFPPTEPSFEARYYDILKAWKIEMERRKAQQKGKGTNK